MTILPVLWKDGYKVGHFAQYPPDTQAVYSNLTPRASRVPEMQGVIFFGLQYFLKEYLQTRFQRDFFAQPKRLVMDEYKRRIESYLGPGAITYDHIAALHDRGCLPLKIKAVPEGTFVPVGVPCLTIMNTEPQFYWLTNMLETIMSSVLWKMSTTATTAFAYRRRFQRYAELTGGDPAFVPWQGHDFSFRGMCGLEDAAANGAAHLLSFTGTDTIPALDFLEQYYYADSDRELIGGSVPATEHSVMCMGLADREDQTFARLINEVYPSGIVSIVSDTWDFWNVICTILPSMKEQILARSGKLVIRPDSGDPVKIICGDPDADTEWVRKGAIECLWEIFGGTTTAKGYRLLDSHIGLIYGDSISLDRQERILAGLAAKGFASTNVVLGIGSYTYQYVTRDTYGFAMKATWGQTLSGGPQDIWKDPVTDSGVKRSHKGLLQVYRGDDGILKVRQQVTPADEKLGMLQTVFHHVPNSHQTLADIRARIEAQL